MGRSKLDKFRENAARSNVLEPGKEILNSIKGNWCNTQFKNSNPLVLELACGKGDYTVGLGRLFPGKNFVGVDIKGSRIWTGSTMAESEQLSNVAFLRIHILNLGEYFDDNEVDSIWITFPDPRPRDRDERKRLTHPRFLEIYRKILKPGGNIFLKTDNEQLFQYSLDILSTFEGVGGLAFTRDLYNSDLLNDHHDLMTNYEKRFLEQGLKIKYLKFSFGK